MEYFLNPWMLAGLAGLSLPVIAHLLSRKKYDVVQWGAMQFLELGKEARRKIKLEELLLLLVRMALIALIAFALARPWASNRLLGRVASGQKRDVVFIIDGSYSMGWKGGGKTPHEQAVQWARDYLGELRAGDTLTIIDARDQVRVVTETPTRDFALIRQQLAELPPPAGSANLSDAVTRAAQILNTTDNLAREIVVLTDGQAKGWNANDTVLWTQIDERLQQPKIRPNIWVVNVGSEKVGERTNFAVSELYLSREVTVPEFPIQIRTKIRHIGGKAAATRKVFLEVDGQRLDTKTQMVPIEANGEASLEFEYRFPSVGSHVISVALEEDNLPGDNRADAALNISDPPPALLVDGDPQLDPVKRETRFLKDALSPTINPTPWVQAAVIPWDELNVAGIPTYEVIVLANVRRLTGEQAAALKDYVSRGGGLWIILGDRVDPATYNQLLWDNGQGLLPAKIDKIDQDREEDGPGVMVTDTSLELNWMERFRSDNNGGFTEARFTHWWKVTLPDENAAEKPPEENEAAEGEEEKEPAPPVKVGTPLIAAALNNNQPLLISRKYGRGGVVLMTAAMDADWSTLVSKHDYVALAHEVVFHLASAKESRNVNVGIPLVIPVEDHNTMRKYAWFGPGDTEFPPQPAGDEITPLAQLSDTQLAGIYSFQLQDKSRPADADYFVVNFDRGESDLTPLSQEEKDFLTENDRMKLVGDMDELAVEMFADDSKSELWQFLMFIFLGVLVFEVIMTRRLVKGGHAAVEPVEEPKPEEELIILTPLDEVAAPAPLPRRSMPRPIPKRNPRRPR